MIMAAVTAARFATEYFQNAGIVEFLLTPVTNAIFFGLVSGGFVLAVRQVKFKVFSWYTRTTSLSRKVPSFEQ